MIRVLVADDHAVVRDGLRMILEAERDMEVVGAAATGGEAIALATELTPDVVVLDVAMPDLNGLEAARRIRTTEPGVQVVILSMHATSEHLHQALAAGVMGYVVKSAAGTELVRAVRTAAAGRRHLSEPLARMAVELSHRRSGPAGTAGPLASLSEREWQVLQLVVQGRSSAEIAATLSLSSGTVDTYRSRIMRKLRVDDLVGLIRFAVQHGLTPP